MKRRAVVASVAAVVLAGCTGPAADDDGTTDGATTDGATDGTTDGTTTDGATTDGTTDGATTDGTTTDSTTDGTTTDDTMDGTTTDGDAPVYEDTDFEVLRVDCGSPAEDATVAFDEGAASVTVEGTTSGRDSCYTARVASATYDGQADEYRLAVEAYSDADPDEACADCIVEIDYEATATFDGGLPGEVVVVHRGSEGETEVASASP